MTFKMAYRVQVRTEGKAIGINWLGDLEPRPDSIRRPKVLAPQRYFSACGDRVAPVWTTLVDDSSRPPEKNMLYFLM